ncbi:MAG: leucine-rich repeat domain-containing protein [Bacteroidetes bacterium]|nr:leucine-rich repeat domain-containing protein [Bacteroidota bacterium]
MLRIFTILGIFCLHFSVNAQLLSPDELEQQPVYNSLSQALKNPEKVYRLDLSKQKLQVIPKAIFGLYNLQELILAKNKLHEIPQEIANLTNLQKLNVSKNNLTELPAAIGALTNLEVLVANQNDIYKLPAEIGNLINLEFLDLWSNEIDVFPEQISKLKDTLKKLDLRVVLINDEKQKAIADLLPNTDIYFSKSCNCH